ncbi:hypothetical protein PTKIN_Ptkin03bG0075200 [Pterospermum kingtungense]
MGYRNAIEKGERSVEEADLLEWSTKKSRTVAVTDKSCSMEMVPETPMEDMVEKYKSPEVPDIIDGDDKSWLSDEEEYCEDEEEENYLTIRISREEKARLCKPWRLTLIVKVIGRSIRYNYLLRRIKALWKPKSQMEMVALENDFFLVRFSSVEDYNFAKFEGLWMVLDHYLIVKEWTPDFDPNSDYT